MLLAVAAILLIPRGTEPDGFGGRGNTLPPPAGVQIIITGFDSEEAEEIAKMFDREAVKIVNDAPTHISQTGRTIVIDGADKEIEGYRDAEDTDPEVVPLPATPEDIKTEAAALWNLLKK